MVVCDKVYGEVFGVVGNVIFFDMVVVNNLLNYSFFLFGFLDLSFIL